MYVFFVVVVVVVVVVVGVFSIHLLATINDKSRWDSLLFPYLIVDVQPTKIILFVC